MIITKCIHSLEHSWLVAQKNFKCGRVNRFLYWPDGTGYRHKGHSKRIKNRNHKACHLHIWLSTYRSLEPKNDRELMGRSKLNKLGTGIWNQEDFINNLNCKPCNTISMIRCLLLETSSTCNTGSYKYLCANI